jgi:hypothetical protein
MATSSRSFGGKRISLIKGKVAAAVRLLNPKIFKAVLLIPANSYREVRRIMPCEEDSKRRRAPFEKNKSSVSLIAEVGATVLFFIQNTRIEKRGSNFGITIMVIDSLIYIILAICDV